MFQKKNPFIIRKMNKLVLNCFKLLKNLYKNSIKKLNSFSFKFVYFNKINLNKITFSFSNVIIFKKLR